jgi:hypothetical protein
VRGSPQRPFIVFYFPFRHPSGVSNLFVRLAERLTSMGECSAAIIDYPDGQIAMTLGKSSGVALIPFDDDAECVVPPNSVFVTQSLLPYTLPGNLKIDTDVRIVQWHFLVAALVNTLVPFGPMRDFQHRHPSFYRTCMRLFLPSTKRDLEDFIIGMAENGALIFHDRRILEQTEDYLGLKVVNPALLPVPVTTGKNIGARSEDRTTLRCGWVGRLYDFKIHILVHVILRLSAWSRKNGRKIEFRVVGDGEEEKRLDAVNAAHEYFELIREGAVPGDRLASYMGSNFDLAFSMGTSALESAAIGILTVLLDYSNRPISRPYRFMWLFDRCAGAIGHVITVDDAEDGEDSLERILDEYFEDRRGIASRCRDYCELNHGVDTIARRFLEIASSSRYTWGDVPARLKKVSLPRKLRARLRSVIRRKNGKANKDIVEK